MWVIKQVFWKYQHNNYEKWTGHLPSSFSLHNQNNFYLKITSYYAQCNGCRRSQWPSGLRRWSSAGRLLGSRVWIPTGAWMFVGYECCVFSGRDLCDGPIPRPEESYRLWLCDCLWSHERITLYTYWLSRKRLDWERKKERSNVCR